MDSAVGAGGLGEAKESGPIQHGGVGSPGVKQREFKHYKYGGDPRSSIARVQCQLGSTEQDRRQNTLEISIDGKFFLLLPTKMP